MERMELTRSPEASIFENCVKSDFDSGLLLAAMGNLSILSPLIINRISTH